MNEKTLLMDYNDKPKTGKWIALSFQHVFAMFSATVLVPILLGLPISIALFSSGVGTLIYILCTKAKVPMYLGSSFAYITYLQTVLVGADDLSKYGAAITAIVVVGVIYIIIAIIIKFVGTKWLHKVLPPVVVGPMIIVIGLCLASNAVSNSGLSVADGAAIDWKTIVVALVTMFTTAALSIRGKGFLRVIPFVIGIAAGYVAALIVNWIPGSAQILNFTDLIAVAKDPSRWFALPDFVILGWSNQKLFANVSMAKINFSAAIAIIPIAFATICEHIGDHQVLGEITNRNYAEDPGLHRTLLGDGIATAFAGAIGSVPNTSYGENTAVVGITKVGSVWVTGLAAVIAICLSFINIFATLISTIPTAVIGGLCLVLYGFIASNGLKVLIDKKVNMKDSRNIIIVSVMLIIGIGGAKILSFSGMALAAIFGILLNALLPRTKEEKPKENEEVSNNTVDEKATA